MLSAAATSLSVSTDDAMWLLPFMVHRKRTRFAASYFLCMQIIVLAAALYWGASRVLKHLLPEGTKVEETFSWASTVVMCCYTLFLFREWLREARSDEGEDQVPEVAEQLTEGHKEQQRTLRQLMIICLATNLDNFAIYSTLLTTRAVDLPQLVLGVLLASALVVTICCGAGLLKPVVSFIQQIPLWVVLVVVCVWSVVSNVSH